MCARPREFIEHWAPRIETQAWLDIIGRVLLDYAEQLPLTIRQIFYRLVGRHNYEKTEQARAVGWRIAAGGGRGR